MGIEEKYLKEALVANNKDISEEIENVEETLELIYKHIEDGIEGGVFDKTKSRKFLNNLEKVINALVSLEDDVRRL